MLPAGKRVARAAKEIRLPISQFGTGFRERHARVRICFLKCFFFRRALWAAKGQERFVSLIVPLANRNSPSFNGSPELLSEGCVHCKVEQMPDLPSVGGRTRVPLGRKGPSRIRSVYQLSFVIQWGTRAPLGSQDVFFASFCVYTFYKNLSNDPELLNAPLRGIRRLL